MFSLKKENTKVEIALSIDNKEWATAVEQVYEKSKSKFNVVGFRKGHAPRKVIEQQYGDSVFFEDTIEYFVNKTLNEVLDKNPELEPVTMPATKFESFTVSDGLKMSILFDIVPDFEMCKFKDATIKAHDNKVTDHDVEHEIKHLLEDNAKYEIVERDSKIGDSLVIDFAGFIDGVAFEGGTANDYALELGSHTFIDTFEDQLVGHKKGDEVDVNVTFPENYQAEEYKGKPALFKVSVKEVKAKVLPELNDKFVSDTTEYETVEEYRKHVSAHIQDMKSKQMDEEVEYNIREFLLENTKVEIPEVMIENTVNEDINKMKEALVAYNITLEDYLTQTGTTLDAYIKNAKERSYKMIKTRYIYRKLIEQNKIEISAKELEEQTKGVLDANEVMRKENELLLKKLHAFLKKNIKVEIIKD